MNQILSLLLTLALTLSLAAAPADAAYCDAGDIVYDEAVSVISALGVVNGYSNGGFNPRGELTRGAAAKIICGLILGPAAAAELPGGYPYRDVPPDHTFSGYISYCQEEGIISGYADGTFRPAAPLTGYAFMKMLLGALGYDQEIEHYVGSNWAVNVAKQAIGIGLNAGMKSNFVGKKPVTREEAALYAVNTLQATAVFYESKTSVNVNGNEVIVSGSQAKPVRWMDGSNQDGSILSDKFVQFAERNFPELVRRDNINALGFPAKSWTWKGSFVGDFAATEYLVGSSARAVSGSNLHRLLGANGLEGYGLTVSIDGVTDPAVNPAVFDISQITPGSAVPLGGTGNGVLTRVYRDDKNSRIGISISNTYLAIAATDYVDRQGKVNLNVYGLSRTESGQYIKTGADGGEPILLSVYGADFPQVKTVQSGDAVMITVSGSSVQSVSPVKPISSARVTSVEPGSNITANGKTYAFASAMEYDRQILDALCAFGVVDLDEIKFTLYLDNYGYLIGIAADTPPTSYCFLTGLEAGDSSPGAAAMGRVLLPDGIVMTVPVDLQGSILDQSGNLAALNTWCSYVVRNGSWTLTEVPETFASARGIAQAHQTQPAAKLDAGNAAIGLPDGRTVYCNDTTSFLLTEVKETTNAESVPTAAISEVRLAATGLHHVNVNLWGLDTVDALFAANGTENISSGVYVLYDKEANIVSMVAVGSDAAAQDCIFVHGGDVPAEARYDPTWGTYYEYPAVVNGEAKTVRCTNHGLSGDHLFTKVQAVGPLIALGGELTATDPGEILLRQGGCAVGTAVPENGSIGLGGHTYPLAADCRVFRLNDTGSFTESSLSALEADGNDVAWFRLTGGQICFLFLLPQA